MSELWDIVCDMLLCSSRSGSAEQIIRADAEEVCQLSISIRTPAWGVTAKIHKTVFNHLYIFAALCAFCSEITQQKAIIIRILKENTSIHCADLPENYARL